MEETELLKILYNQNPWWEEKAVKVPEKKRRDYYMLQKDLSDKQITAIIGPRRVGKSVLMQQLIQALLQKGTPSKNILFAQLDEPLFDAETGVLISRIIETYSKFILGKSLDDVPTKVYVFLDEVQHVEKWSEALKSYYDKNYKLKFVVSGSSSAGIKHGSSESLAGRILLNPVMTLKFVDFLKFKDENNEVENASLTLREKLKDAIDEKDPESFFSDLKTFYAALIPKQRKIETILSEYMIKGGYIELIEEEDYGKCLQYLRDLIQLVIYKDIVKVFGIRNPKNMEDLLLYLGNHSAEQLSENSMSKKLKMKTETIGEYLDYLEEVFLISTCMIYANNRAKQLRNPKKVYISDCGIRNMLNGTYSPRALADNTDVGRIAETVVRNHLLRLVFHLDTYNSKCYYWKNGTEVDNVIVYAKKTVPVEVKYQNDIKSEDATSCLEFMKENSSPFGIIVTKNKLDYKDRVIYIPLWYFLIIC